MFILYFHNFSAENMTFKLTLHVHTPENPEIQDHTADMAIYYLSCSPKILCTCMHNNPFFSMGEGEHPSLRVLLWDLEGKNIEYQSCNHVHKLFSLVNMYLEKCCFEFPLYIQAYIPLIFLPLGKPTKGSNVGSFFQSGRNSGPYHKSLTGAQLACPIFRALSFRWPRAQRRFLVYSRIKCLNTVIGILTAQSVFGKQVNFRNVYF